MVLEELKFKTHGNRIDNRATMFVGKRNIAPQVEKFIIIGGTNMDTELYVKLKVNKLNIETNVVRKDGLFNQITDKFINAMKKPINIDPEVV